MLNRIPGIGLALEVDSAARYRGGNDRGLGGSDRILINGKRLAGKANEAGAQLNRITADQVDYIEIVRGNSADLDVQNAGQLVNIVLLESLSSIAYSSELGMTHFRDGTVEPSGSFSVSGQTGQLNYQISTNLETRYEALESFEISLLPDLSLNETRAFDRYRDQQNLSINTNLVYQATPFDRVALNALYGNSDPPSKLVRAITDLKPDPAPVVFEREALPASSDNWEFGGDYEHNFTNSGRYKLLFIVNEKNDSINRQRYLSTELVNQEVKNLFLDTHSRYRERILRSSYAWDLASGQNLELGLEGAQTIQDSKLRLGLKIPGIGSPDYGGLVPADPPNAVSTVEEIRYEGFAIHNWQLNSRLSLQSSLLYETSEIEQRADSTKSRSFNFMKPKLDLRFNASNSLQLRLSAEKQVSQLRFADFSASTNDRDEDQDTIAGNPELIPEETWRYDVNIDYRLPEDGGVLNTRLFYYDIKNSIDRIDISSGSDNLATTNGNVGDGTVYGMNFNISLRLARIKLPDAVLTGGLLLQESYIDDPMIARERRVVPYDRGRISVGFRHDITRWNLNYGINYFDGIDGNRPFFDIDNVIYIGSNSNLSLFLEKVGFAGITYRFEADNLLDHQSCRERRRYSGYLRNGILKEIERYCTTNGTRLSFKARATF
ncbi:MAG: TonB-dependent receptor [Pseudomonadales bacterium]|nr:TonB-dependent receptor [Pseudomonadales bacterium]